MTKDKEVNLLEEEVTDLSKPLTVADKQRKYTMMKDGELIQILRDRGLRPAMNEEGRLMRFECYNVLREADERDAVTEKQKRRVRVTFQSSTSPSAGPYVFASINDKNFQAPFDTEVEIPEYMLRECIDRAKTIVYEQEGNFGRRVPRFVSTYPYTFHGYVED